MAARVLLAAQNQLISSDRWDTREKLIEKIEKLLGTETFHKISGDSLALETYLEYFKSQRQHDFEPDPNFAPWKSFQLLHQWNEIPTTTDPETLQLLMWLIKSRRCERVLELGCWFGHSTFAMAYMGTEVNGDRFSIHACDAFQWQTWMAKFTQEEVRVRHLRVSAILLLYHESVQSQK